MPYQEPVAAVSLGRQARPLVAIVGRPNVGKSTFFNRLVGHRRAIVADQPGTTRDRLTAEVTWGDTTFLLVDTGGLELHPQTTLWSKVKAQAEEAIAGADVVVFLTNILEGVTPGDEDIANILRRSGKPIVLATNKADNPIRELMKAEQYRLGLGDPIDMSAYHNIGVEDVLAKVLTHLPVQSEDYQIPTNALHLAIVGRPNVGKSMLLNAILGQERAIVSELPGTTRDALDTPFQYQGTPFILIDTAGIRRRGRIQPGVERYSVLRSIRAIDRADVVLLVMDPSQRFAAQDAHVAGQVSDSFKGMVVAINKWDLAPELQLELPKVQRRVHNRLKFVSYAPVCFLSALRQEGIPSMLDKIIDVYQEGKREVPREELRLVTSRALAAHPPPGWGRRSLRFGKIAQEATGPPTFSFYVNKPELVHFSYRRYLENALKTAFNLQQTPLKLLFKIARPGTR